MLVPATTLHPLSELSPLEAGAGASPDPAGTTGSTVPDGATELVGATVGTAPGVTGATAVGVLPVGPTSAPVAPVAAPVAPVAPVAAPVALFAGTFSNRAFATVTGAARLYH